MSPIEENFFLEPPRLLKIPTSFAPELSATTALDISLNIIYLP
jgi:hypothetical protein